MNLTASGGDESQKTGDDGINNKSSCENVDNIAISNQELKRKHYHRHTPQQIQEMEAVHISNNNQRKELSDKLGLRLLQVKFLFQNKRTQLKTENDELRAENMMYQEALTNACIRACGRAIVVGISSIEHHLRVENAQLRKQIDDLATFVVKLIGKPSMDDATIPSSTDSPTIYIEVVRRIKEKHRIE
ncbi:UNVERIFIED_CONTAM: Homeobox-leucine zipper protein ROC2, partial [Sesamum latifolium]